MYLQKTLNNVIKTNNKVYYVRTMAKKFVETFDKPEENNIVKYTEKILKDIRKKIGLTIDTRKIKTKIDKIDEDFCTVKTNISNALFCFLNTTDSCLFFIISKFGMITYAKFYIGFNFDFSNIKKQNKGRKKGTLVEGSIPWAVEQFIKKYPEVLKK